jgi:hypothetical protein
VSNVYPELSTLKNAVSPDIQDVLLSRAEAEVSGRLAARFSLPFSSDNETFKALAIDTVYVQNNLTRVPEKAKALKESIDERIKALLDGSAQMVTVAGTIASAMADGAIWSDTMNYSSTFGMSDIEKSVVSSERLYAEDNSRGEI